MSVARPAALLFLRFVATVAVLAGGPIVACDPPDTAEPGILLRTPATYQTSASSPKIVVLGDSTAEFLGRAMMSLPEINLVNLGLRRCPLRPDVHHGTLRSSWPGESFAHPSEDATFDVSCAWSEYLPLFDLHGAIVVIYAAPVVEIDFDDGHLPDVAFQATLVDEMGSLVDALWAQGAAKVVLVNPPPAINGKGLPNPPRWLEPGRHDAWQGVLDTVHEVHPDTCWIDYAAFFLTRPDNRPDGMHMEGAGAVEAATWIYDRLPDCPIRNDPL